MELGLYRCYARIPWSSPWPAEMFVRLSGRLVWNTMLSSDSLKSPNQSPKPYSAARVPVSAIGNLILHIGKLYTQIFNKMEGSKSLNFRSNKEFISIT